VIRNAWNWFWEGRMCKRCKIERTHRHFVDDICFTCYFSELIKWLGRP
jgi:hypothetical protein